MLVRAVRIDMTTGTKLINDMVTKDYFYSESSESGPWAPMNNPHGFGYRSNKEWSGGDSKPPRTAMLVKKRYYTVLEPVIVNGVHTGKSKKVTKSYDVYYLPKRAKRALTPNGYLMSLDTVRVTQGTFKSRNYGDPWAPTVWFKDASALQLFGPNLTRPTVDSNFQIALVNKLAAKVSGSDFNMAVFLGEGKQSLKMITDSATRIAKAIYYVRRGKVRKAVSILEAKSLFKKRLPKNFYSLHKGRKDTANTWLELQYGWLPLLSDMKGAAEKLAQHMSVPAAQRVKTSKQSILTQDKLMVPASARWGNYRNEFTRTIRATITEAQSPVALSGILDPELVAWELMPFSFVVDWALPIGSYLEARANSSHITGSFVTTDFLYQGASSFSGGNGPFMGLFREVTGSSSDSTLHVELKRTITASLPVPMPNVKPLAKVASWQHCVSALALLSQSFK